VVFENRERILPVEDRGSYHEYTVPTPGEDDRGARRIVMGDQGQ
jgi:ribonuclease T1